MIGEQTRQTLAHAIIGLGACLGVYAGVVDPWRSELAAARAEVAQVEAELEQLAAIERSPQRYVDEINAARARIEQIDRRSAVARDHGALFEALYEAAARRGLRVYHIDPMDISLAAKARRRGQRLEEAAHNDAAWGFSLEIVGRYADLALFLDDLARIGFARVTLVELIPVRDDDPDAVSATVRTEHYVFEAAPPEPAPAGGGA
ncbi:MAG: hypothetical protein ACF8R7_03400 [Phycisphaerales bacterium JB039]